jgi:hypothetical protein
MLHLSWRKQLNVVGLEGLSQTSFDNNNHMNYFFIGLYCIDMDIICLFILFKHECHAHCLNTNVICYLYTFEHDCHMSIHLVSTWRSCPQISCLDYTWHSCLNNTTYERKKIAQLLLLNRDSWSLWWVRLKRNSISPPLWL